jgi:hypothetical protein
MNVGDRFGKLTAIRQTGIVGKSNCFKWIFRCECGKNVERDPDYVLTSYKRGNIPCCASGGCKGQYAHPPNTEPIRLEITGQKFGKLTAIEPTGKIDSKRYAIWKFRCECGDIVERSASSLKWDVKRGRNPSCAKSTCNNRVRLKPGHAARHELIWAYKMNAKKRGHEFSLSNEELDVLFAGNCFYCGVPPKQIAPPSTKTDGSVCESGGFTHNGIDRVDNQKGYIAGNVVSCCFNCNRAKMAMPIDEFVEWVDRLTKNFPRDKFIHD